MYLQLAGLLKSPKRAHFQITPRGADVLQSPPSRIDLKFLEQYPEFVAFRNPRVVPPVPDTQPLEDEPESPEEALETAHLKMRAGLASELLSRVKAAPPKFFEQLVVQLLINMDYGGSRKDAGQAIGHVGDDGIISEDRLGLDIVYLQAKRGGKVPSEGPTSKSLLALWKRAKKGVFITTGTFSSEATEYVAHIEPRVVLIDGRQLAELMIDFDVGVNTVAVYRSKRVDSDYFEEN